MPIHPHLEPIKLSPAELWAQRIVDEHVRAMDPLDRLERMEDLNRAAKQMALINLRERYPAADEDELNLRLAALRYGREFTVHWFGWDPEIQGW